MRKSFGRAEGCDGIRVMGLKREFSGTLANLEKWMMGVYIVEGAVVKSFYSITENCG